MVATNLKNFYTIFSCTTNKGEAGLSLVLPVYTSHEMKLGRDVGRGFPPERTRSVRAGSLALSVLKNESKPEGLPYMLHVKT